MKLTEKQKSVMLSAYSDVYHSLMEIKRSKTRFTETEKRIFMNHKIEILVELQGIFKLLKIDVQFKELPPIQEQGDEKTIS